MPLTSADVVETIRITYSQLDNNSDAILAKCTTDAQRDNLKASLASARGAYFDAEEKAFAMGNPTVRTLTQQLDTSNKDLQAQLVELKNIVAFLNAAVEAAKLAVSLASLAA